MKFDPKIHLYAPASFDYSLGGQYSASIMTDRPDLMMDVSKEMG